jgi:phytanoyl-CoA hydroxylase
MVTASKTIAEQFLEKGFVKVEGVLDPATVLDPVIEEYHGVLDNLAADLFGAGEISSRFEELPFDKRLIKIYQETGQAHSQYFDFSLPFQNVRDDTPFWTGPAVFNAFVNENLLDVVEEFIGPEIYSNPVQHVRIKPPEKYLPKNDQGLPVIGPTVWHQDNGVVTDEADDTNMVTTWFSLTDTPVESGPLRVVPGSHRTGLLTHCDDYAENEPWLRGRQIPQRLFDYEHAIPVPTKRGDVIFLHKQLVHGSLSNVSNQVRWSFDLRYNPIGQSTGREIFPGFVARSRTHPESELRSAEDWRRSWLDCRARMARINQADMDEVPFDRWADGHPDCET